VADWAAHGPQPRGCVERGMAEPGQTISEVLVLGVPDGDGHVVLVEPQAEVPLGGRLC
jgi:hypothetical protein